jgi:molybdenum cofactor biosynthesis protein MoaC
MVNSSIHNDDCCEHGHDIHGHDNGLQGINKKLKEFISSSHYHMVDVGAKVPSFRKAIAKGCIEVGEAVFSLIESRALPKGDALMLAEIAGIQGAKRAHDMIPLCHPLTLEHISVLTELDKKNHSIIVYCLVSTFAKTGVEMEALAGVNAALLSIYDLSKMINPALLLHDIRLLYKEGGKHGTWTHPLGIPQILQSVLENSEKPLEPFKVAILSISDRAYNKVENYPDIGGALKDGVTELGALVVGYHLLPDEKGLIVQHIQTYVAEQSPDLIMIHGGTGLSQRDVTPEAITMACDRLIPGFGELIRKESEKYTPYTWLSRCNAGILQESLIISIPGKKQAIPQVLNVLKKILPKAIHEIQKHA